MKALSTLVSLAAIIFLVVVSADLFLKDQFALSYSLMIVWIASIILWVKFAARVWDSTLFGKAGKA